MVKGIHITGASGSGTTTLGKALNQELGYYHFDADDYFWYPTDPPYRTKRPIIERQDLLRRDLQSQDKWVISGSFCGWGDIFIPKLDLVIYLWVPTEVRIKRLKKREKENYGDAIEPGGNMYWNHKDFLKWASNYENGGLKMRSKATHKKWLKKINCPVLKIEGEIPL